MTEKDDIGRIKTLKENLDAAAKEKRSLHIYPKECADYADALGRQMERKEGEVPPTPTEFPWTAMGWGYLDGVWGFYKRTSK